MSDIPTDDDLVTIGKTADALRADCLRLLAHDMNNALTAIRVLAEVLRDEVTDQEMRQDVIDVLEAADLASAQMDGMSSLVRLDYQEDEYTWFPLDLVHLLREVVSRPALRRHVRLDLPREVQMGGDLGALKRAFTDIFVNARRLVDSQQVLVFATEGEETVELRVRHPMPGIPVGMRDRLFDMYGAVELRQNRIPVSAVGLVYARSVIDNHGGTIAFDGEPGGAMDLVVTLRR